MRRPRGGGGAVRAPSRRASPLAKAVRVLAVSGTVAAASFVSAPSRAGHEIVFVECGSASSPAPSSSAQPTQPPGSQTQECVPPQGARLTGDRMLRFELEDNGARPQDVKLFVLSQEKSIPSANEGRPVATWFPDQNQRTFWYEWSTGALTAYNGKYKVRVESIATSPSTHTAVKERTDLRVDNPPGPVAAPKILSATPQAVTIGWRKASEPDTVGFAIYRASAASASAKSPPYAAFKKIGVSTKTSYSDETATPGYAWYAVKVVRRSVVTPQTGISSAFSPVSRRATVVKLKPTPAPPIRGGEHGGGGARSAVSSNPLPPLRHFALPGNLSGDLPDAPFSWKLPYGEAPQSGERSTFLSSGPRQGRGDPRAPVLPVAVGMFLVSSALAVGRMPY